MNLHKKYSCPAARSWCFSRVVLRLLVWLPAESKKNILRSVGDGYALNSILNFIFFRMAFGGGITCWGVVVELPLCSVPEKCAVAPEHHLADITNLSGHCVQYCFFSFFTIPKKIYYTTEIMN